MHNEARSSAWREAQLGMFTGCIYGGTHTFTGHPLDTIKSKMQIQVGYTKGSAWKVAGLIWRTEGVAGFFRGCVPPLWGSMVYRGVMISSYEYSYTWLEKNTEAEGFVRNKQASLGGLRPIVPLSALFASVCRGFFESPIEYAKLMGQTGQHWHVREAYRGVGFQVLRTTALMIPIFSGIDLVRQSTSLLDSLGGNFAVTALVCSATYFVCAPLETLKNLAQSGTPRVGATLSERIAFLGGPKGLVRGIWPGTLCGGLRNGCGMVAMIFAQRWATKLGLR